MFDFNVSHSAYASANAMRPVPATSATARTHMVQNNFVHPGRRGVYASSSRAGNSSVSAVILAITPFENARFIRTLYFCEMSCRVNMKLRISMRKMKYTDFSQTVTHFASSSTQWTDDSLVHAT